MTPATLIIVGRIVAFLGAAAAAVGLGLTGAKLALVVSTWILAGLVGSHLLLDLGWIRLEVNTASTTGETPKDWSAAFKDGANLVITVEGVILGLVFAFVVGKGTGGTLVNIGAASLAAGVVVGILLYSLAAGGIPNDWGAAIASLMLNVSLYALAYGLICIVGALITVH